MDNQLFYGSLNFTELVAKAKAGHSAFSKADNGKIYFNVNVWLNAEPDKFGNSMSISLNSKKDLKDAEGKVYIGNCKKSDRKENQPLGSADANSIPDLDALPVAGRGGSDISAPVDDLPF